MLYRWIPKNNSYAHILHEKKSSLRWGLIDYNERSSKNAHHEMERAGKWEDFKSKLNEILSADW